jgi:hypothetical protein
MDRISEDEKLVKYRTQIQFMNIIDDCKRLAKNLKDEQCGNHLLNAADQINQISEHYHNITK